MAFRAGGFSGCLASPNCCGPEKVRRLQRWPADYRPHVLFAYDDGRGDQQMLALADHAWQRGHGAMPPLEHGRTKREGTDRAFGAP
ncbi:hypothetical protein J7E62_00315 [Variovorax paradoxus]|nr:hypothetical protein [Variovorax paradoxus]